MNIFEIFSNISVFPVRPISGKLIHFLKTLILIHWFQENSSINILWVSSWCKISGHELSLRHDPEIVKYYFSSVLFLWFFQKSTRDHKILKLTIKWVSPAILVVQLESSLLMRLEISPLFFKFKVKRFKQNILNKYRRINDDNSRTSW